MRVRRDWFRGLASPQNPGHPLRNFRTWRAKFSQRSRYGKAHQRNQNKAYRR